MKLGFPHCIGAVNGTHIHMLSPRGQAAEFINRKSTYSKLHQGKTDHTGCFIAVEIGYRGITHDFKQSALCQAMDMGVFVSGNPSI